jgi:hypothetical protein
MRIKVNEGDLVGYTIEHCDHLYNTDGELFSVKLVLWHRERMDVKHIRIGVPHDEVKDDNFYIEERT